MKSRSNFGARSLTAHYRHLLCTGLITVLTTASLVVVSPVTQASVQHCTTRYSDEVQNISPTGVTFIVVSAFTLSCSGNITGSLHIKSRGISTTQLQIEKKNKDTWQTVERGNQITHQAGPGTYRLSVEQTEKRGAFVSWRLRYSKPLP